MPEKLPALDHQRVPSPDFSHLLVTKRRKGRPECVAPHTTEATAWVIGWGLGLKIFRLEGFCDPFERFSEPSCGLGLLDLIQVDGNSAFTDELIVTLHPFHRFLCRLAAVRARN